MGVAQRIAEHLAGSPSELITFIIAMLPIVELRGAIPWALTLGGLEWPQAVTIAIIGNLVPIPLILLLLGPVSRLLSRWPLFDRFFQWLFARTRRKGRAIERYQALGLILFVGIPIPGTGAWTGSLAAFVFGIPFRRAMGCILIGVFLAAVIVTLSTLGVIGVVRLIL